MRAATLRRYFALPRHRCALLFSWLYHHKNERKQMAHIAPMARRYGAVALSIVLAFSMPGTAAFAGNMTEIAAEPQSQTQQTLNENDNTANDAVAAEGTQHAENAQPTESEQPAEPTEGTFGISADDPQAEEPSSEDGALAAALGQSEQDVAAAQNAENGAESQRSSDARVAKAGETVTVASADELPTTIEAGATVKLAANISLSSGQQIELVAGTLDGQGHSVELNGKALAKNVTGVVQNLGVTGQATMGDFEGALAINCSGTVQMCWSTAGLTDGGSWVDYGGLIGTLNSGSLTNSYVAGSMSGFCAHGLVGWYKSGTVA